MARTTPRVAGATLVARADDARAIAVGTPAWYAWLERATTFAFVGVAGSFTARKERRQRADGYWKAYRKRAGVVRSAYLGKSADLSLERLQSAAATLAELALPGEAPARSGAALAPPEIDSSVRMSSSLPVGTVTFLFTDIAGSTTLWEQHPQAMPAVLAGHDAILRQTVAAHHGAVFKTVGDSVHAVFATAPDALSAALSGQRALHAEPWGKTGPLRVRMALHTGAAELRDGDYFGPPLNRLARILALGHGGQILLSLATEELVRDHLPPGATLRDQGVHQLKDLNYPEQIFQLVSADLPAEFPPLRTFDIQPAQSTPHPLLATKLSIPPPRPNLVVRPHLIERLRAGIQHKLTLIAAPAGFGKTTVVSAWYAARTQGQGLRTERRHDRLSPQSSALDPRVAWVSLDTTDNDAMRFWAYMVTALDTLQPGVGRTALALLQSPQPPPIQAILTMLLNDLSEVYTNTALVLDDYHVIDAPAIHHAMAFLLDHLPPQLHLVIATRVDPPLPLSRLRARGELTELRAADLCFAADEATTFLTQVMGLPLSAADVAALETRTEGWIAGLQFAALAMRDRTDHASFIAAFTGSHRFIVDYLAEEVFVQQPRHIQTFLLQTSILDRMCGPLCDALLGLTSDQGQMTNDQAVSEGPFVVRRSSFVDSYSQLILGQLERANLFLTALDDERHWYRYHHLFAEVLRTRLHGGASAETVATLHGRASVWYEQQGLVVEAVQHALAAHDWERAAGMIEQIGMAVMLPGQVHTLLRWLAMFPDSLLRARPVLAIVHGAAFMFANQIAAAVARLDDAERSVQADTEPAQARNLLGQIAAVRGNLARLTGNLARCVTLSQQALGLLPETSFMQVLVRLNAAYVYLVHGDVTPAMERMVTDVLAPVRATGNLATILRSLMLLARMHVHQGRLRQAAATYAMAAQVAPGPEGSPALINSAAYSFGMGDLLREWDDLDSAERYLRQGMALVPDTLTVGADVVALGYLALARLLQARGAASAAHAVLDAFAVQARERGFAAHLIVRAAAVQAQLWLAQDNLSAAFHWAETSGLSLADEPDSAHEVASFAYEGAHLTLVRVAIAQGRANSSAQHLTAALDALERLLQAAEAGARMHSVIEILSLRALAHYTRSNLPDALTALTRALVLAEPEGYVRVFVDAGVPMAELLAQVAARASPVAAYATRLLEAFASVEGRGLRAEMLAPARSALSHQSSTLVEPLTEREREVLRLIAAGKSNAQIAQALVVAVSTVKAHVNHLFGKLAVNSRTQAIARAHELHLLYSEEQKD